MTNKHYQKGKRKEYLIVNKLRSKGFDIVQRSAGSHSKIDVWAIHRAKKAIFLVQSKPDSMSERQKNKLKEELSWLHGRFMVKFYVV